MLKLLTKLIVIRRVLLSDIIVGSIMSEKL